MFSRNHNKKASLFELTSVQKLVTKDEAKNRGENDLNFHLWPLLMNCTLVGAFYHGWSINYLWQSVHSV